jgi:2,4-dienoyl-CoA reductase-like NADH-dependent reductase (Old Yellow Enzyme family)
MPFDKLLSPIVVGAREIRNRVVVTAHSTSEQFRNPALPAEPYIDYLRRRAAGGVGLIIACLCGQIRGRDHSPAARAPRPVRAYRRRPTPSRSLGV